MARLLLWYDGVGVHHFGIAELPDWLSKLDSGAFKPSDVGRVGPEHASTALMEAGAGLSPLILARAAEIAGQKARDTGAGIVRVIGLPPAPGPSAAVAADLAIGPFLGAVLGPGAAQAAAIPSADGVPLVFDSAFEGAAEDLKSDRDDPIGPLRDRLAPWALLAGKGEVMVAALAVSAFEPLSAFHERVDEGLRGREAPTGWIFPAASERIRCEAERYGVPLDVGVVDELRRRSAAAGIPFPEPFAAIS